MPKVNLPHASEPVLDNNKFGSTWNRFMHDTWLRIGGGEQYSLGGSLSTNTTSVGNVGVGEDNMITYSLEKNTLKNVGDTIEIVAYGTTAANGNNKTIKLVIGTTTLFTTGAVAFNNKDWCIKSVLTRTGTTSQRAITTFQGDFSLITNTATYVTGTEDFRTALTIKCTGTATSDNDISQKGLIITAFPR